MRRSLVIGAQPTIVGRTGDPYMRRTPLPDIPSVAHTLAEQARGEPYHLYLAPQQD